MNTLKITIRRTLLAAGLLVGTAGHALANTNVAVLCDQADGQYQVGQRIVFKIGLYDNGQRIAGPNLIYRLTVNGETKEGIIKASLVPEDVTCVAPAPGFVFCQVTSAAPAVAQMAVYAVVEPEKTFAQTPFPVDFTAFWERQKARLAQVPLNPVVTPVEIMKDFIKKSVKAYDVKVDCAGGLPVTGYLAMPMDASATKRYPLRISFHGHSYFPRQGSHLRDTDAVMRHMIFFDVNPHGLPSGLPIDYYKENIWPLLRGQAGPYPYRDWNDLEKVYFNGMFLRVVRALEYAKTRPEWDGKNLIVEGSSMGGTQALVAAGLDPQVTICVANVPAMGDHLGAVSGWPSLLARTKADPDLLRKHAPYYDMVNFALQSKARMLLGVGLRDTVCPPPSVWAIYNHLPGSKTIVVSPAGIHNWNQEMRDAREPWIQLGLK